MRYVALFIVAAMALCPVAAGERPKILILLTDDMGYQDVACYGIPVARSVQDPLVCDYLE